MVLQLYKKVHSITGMWPLGIFLKSHHVDWPPCQEQKGHFWHAQGFCTHVVPVQILVPVVQGLVARGPPFKKLDREEVVVLQIIIRQAYIHSGLRVNFN